MEKQKNFKETNYILEELEVVSDYFPKSVLKKKNTWLSFFNLFKDDEKKKVFSSIYQSYIKVEDLIYNPIEIIEEEPTLDIEDDFNIQLSKVESIFNYDYLKSIENINIFQCRIETRANNAFCTLIDKNTCTTLISVSTGSLKFKVSKKNLKKVFYFFLYAFLNKVRLLLKSITVKNVVSILTVDIITRSNLTKVVIKSVSKALSYKSLQIFFSIPENRCFNGCRPKKSPRKKSLGIHKHFK